MGSRNAVAQHVFIPGARAYKRTPRAGQPAFVTGSHVNQFMPPTELLGIWQNATCIRRRRPDCLPEQPALLLGSKQQSRRQSSPRLPPPVCRGTHQAPRAYHGCAPRRWQPSQEDRVEGLAAACKWRSSECQCVVGLLRRQARVRSHTPTHAPARPHLSNLPGRSRAASKQSGRLVAAITTTPLRDCSRQEGAATTGRRR